MRVNNLEATVKFYEEVIGLNVSRRHVSTRGAQLAFLQAPNTDVEIEICQNPAGAESVRVQPDLIHIAFEVENMTAYTLALQEKGIELSSGPTITPKGSVIAFLLAPEGYEIELVQRAR